MQPDDFTIKKTGRLERARGGIYCFVPNPLGGAVSIGRELSLAYQNALLALGELRACIPRLPSPTLVTNPFLRREAILSSKIEGTNTELEQLYLFEMEEDDSSPPSRLDANERNDAQEVHNYISALSYGMKELEARPIHIRLLKEVHAKLLTGTVRGKDKNPGEFRDDRIAYVGGSSPDNARYVATPPGDLLTVSMNDLERYINSTTDETPLLIKVALVHYQFEAIHPFNDGNGRLGRLLMSLLLAQWGLVHEPLLYLSAYFERNREDYYQKMWEVSRAGAWQDWLLFFLNGVTTEAKDACGRADKLASLREKYRSQFHKRGSSAKALELVDYLFTFPFVTIRKVEAVLGLSYQAAKKNVEKLVGGGVLAKLGDQERNRVFIARGILDLLN